MAKKHMYRWVEPETETYDDNGNKIIIPEHQEQGEYINESSIPGYCIVLWNGKKHLIKSTDVVMIFDE